MGKSKEVILMSKDTLIFLLQQLGFIINVGKSVLEPTQKIEFFELINTLERNLSLKTEEKQTKITTQCQNIFSQPHTSYYS